MSISAESILVKLRGPKKIILSHSRLDDLIKAHFRETLKFVTGSPWKAFADILINQQSRTFVGLTFEANKEDKQVAFEWSKRCNSCVRLVEDQNTEHKKYPSIYTGTSFLEIYWGSQEATSFEKALSESALFGYEHGESWPSWLGFDNPPLILRPDQYNLRLPEENQWTAGLLRVA